jgi:MFS family permease
MVKLGIYGIGFLIMGAMGISGSLAVIAESFPEVSQVMIQNLISIPCITIIPTTIIAGRLMRGIAKKWIAVGGILAFIVGGAAPAFMSSFAAILAFRGLLGVGAGVCQVVGNALVAENFSGAEKEKVQGALVASGMGGAAVMVFLSGALSGIGWEFAFYVHLLAIVPMFLVLFCLPSKKPDGAPRGMEGPRVKITPECWLWVVIMFVLFIGIQVYPVFLSFLVAEKGMGAAVDSGLGLAFFSVGGIFMGLLFGRFSKIFKGCTLAIGCAMLAISDVLIALSANMAACHAGSFLFGMGNSIVASGIFLGAGMSVDPFSVPMAISLVTCAQNLGQFISPLAINMLVRTISPGNVNFAAFICAGAISAVISLLMLLWRGWKKRGSA